MSEEELDPHVELRRITASLGAHLEWLAESGAHGLPRDPEARARALAIDAELSALGIADVVAPAPTPALAAHPPAASAHRSDARADVAPNGELVPGAVPERPAPDAVPHAAARALLALDQPHDRADEPNAPAPRATLQLAAAHPARTLGELASAVAACRSCELCEKRTQTVFSRGTPQSRLCFVGEGPGADEDAQGEPFVGKAGQLLDRMIQAMGFSRDEIYVCNVVKCRPPDNRKPTAEEMTACSSFLHRQLELVDPRVIVALGATALEGLLGKNAGKITAVRGNWRLYRGKVPVMPTFHPAYLLRTESAKKDVWSDLKLVVEQMGRELPQKR